MIKNRVNDDEEKMIFFYKFNPETSKRPVTMLLYENFASKMPS